MMNQLVSTCHAVVVLHCILLQLWLHANFVLADMDLCVLKLLHAFAQHCSLSECVEHQNLHQHMFQSLKYSARSVFICK